MEVIKAVTVPSWINVLPGHVYSIVQAQIIRVSIKQCSVNLNGLNQYVLYCVGASRCVSCPVYQSNTNLYQFKIIQKVLDNLSLMIFIRHLALQYSMKGHPTKTHICFALLFQLTKVCQHFYTVIERKGKLSTSM